MKKLPVGLLLLLLFLLIGCQEDAAPTAVTDTNISDIAVEPTSNKVVVVIEVTATPPPPATATPLPPPTATPIPAAPITAQNLASLTRVDRLGKGDFGRFSLDAQGDLAAVATATGMYLFDAATLEERLFVVDGDEMRSRVTAVAFSPDGQTVAVAFNNGDVALYDTAEGEELRRFQTGDHSIFDMLFSADGQNLILNFTDEIQVRNQVDGSVVQTLAYQYATSMALSRNGARLMVMGDNPRVFDLATGEVLRMFVDSQQTNFDYAALSPDGSLLATTGDNLSVWQVDDGTLVWQEPGLHGPVAFSPDSLHLAAEQGLPGVVNVYSVADGAALSTFTMNGAVLDIAFAPDGTAVFTADFAGLTRWTLAGAVEAHTDGFINWALCMAVADDGRTIVLGGEGGRVEVWDLDRKALVQQFTGHTGFVKGVALSADGGLAASIGLDNMARVWNVEDGSLLWEIEAVVLPQPQPITGRTPYFYKMMFYLPLEIALSPDGRYLAFAADSGVQLWDMESGSLLQQFPSTFNYQEQQLTHFAFSPDGTRLVFSYGLSGNIVSVPDGENIGSVGEWIEAEDIVYTSDGSEIIMLGRTAQEREPFVQIWGTKADSGVRSYSLSERNKDWGGPLGLTPDGRHLILVNSRMFNSNNSLLFFDVISGQLTHSIWRTGVIYDYAFSGDGSRLITGVMDKGIIEIWGIRAGENDVSVLPTATPTLQPVNYSCANVTEIPRQDCEALIALYQSTNGDNWTDNNGWLQNNTPCSWIGVNCSMMLHKVTHVMLSENNLQGVLPPSLGNFTGLAWLDLSDNNLTGSIPPELTNTPVENIVLGNNALTGLIPEGLGKSGSPLMVLDLGNNQLSGPLPDSLGNLTSLSILFVQDNPLSGPLPATLTDLPMFNFKFQNTQLCVPADAAFQNWLTDITNLEQSGLRCDP